MSAIASNVDPNSLRVDDGPRYCLALYDRDDHIGYVPWVGDDPTNDTKNIDRYYSSTFTMLAAVRRASEFAPIRVVPYDLCTGMPLDSSSLETHPMSLRDEEMVDNCVPRQVESDHPRSVTGPNSAALAEAQRFCDREMAKSLARDLVSAYRDTVRLLVVLFGPTEA